MSSGLIQLIKQAAMDAIENSKPADLRLGTVATEKPLSVRITNQFVIPEKLLIVPQHLTEYELEITIKPEYNWITEDTQNKVKLSEVEPHKHDIKQDKKKIFIHNKLKVGDKVALLRRQGGQDYYILDRLPKE